MPEKKTAIVNESHFVASQQGKMFITHDPEVFGQGDVGSEIFSAEYWQSKEAVVGKAQGRGTTWFIKIGQYEYVLRHYYRGGLIGKFIRDHYPYFGLQQSRAYREFHLLSQLSQLGLPVPEPAAFAVTKAKPLNCVNDIITKRIENAESLVAKLCQQDIDYDVLMETVGKTIRQFHNAQVYHHDLNANNILLDEKNKAWLIDFDQGRIMNGEKWKQANLERLLRSLHKEAGRIPGLHWKDSFWNRLTQAYNKAN